MKQFFADFKKFITKGNILDMAVGIIIGSAFSAIVTALTNKIIMPLINLLLSANGENGLERTYTFLKVVRDSNGNINLEKSIYIDWGSFITAVINFLIIAFVLFLILRASMRADKIYKEALKDLKSKEARQEKIAIIKKAKSERRSVRKVWKEHLAEKQRVANENAKKAEAEQKIKDDEFRKNNPTQEELLKEIRDLLKANSAKKQ